MRLLVYLFICFISAETDGILGSCTVKPSFGIRATVATEPRWCLNLSFFNNPTFLILSKHIEHSKWLITVQILLCCCNLLVCAKDHFVLEWLVWWWLSGWWETHQQIPFTGGSSTVLLVLSFSQQQWLSKKFPLVKQNFAAHGYFTASMGDFHYCCISLGLTKSSIFHQKGIFWMLDKYQHYLFRILTSRQWCLGQDYNGLIFSKRFSFRKQNLLQKFWELNGQSTVTLQNQMFLTWLPLNFCFRVFILLEEFNYYFKSNTCLKFCVCSRLLSTHRFLEMRREVMLHGLCSSSASFVAI